MLIILETQEIQLIIPIFPYHPKNKGTLMGTPNREAQEYSRNIIGVYLPKSSNSIMFLLSILGVSCLGSLKSL